MKKFLQNCILLIAVFAFIQNGMAQCSGGRYFEQLFPEEPVKTSDIEYGSNLRFDSIMTALTMDIYQPAGDQSNKRALIIIAHGGSFVLGSKNELDVVPFAKDLAKLGYVCATINYRLGMTNIASVDSFDAAPAILRGVHDGKAAVRFFRKNVVEAGNTYGIDTNNIFFAGVSAGGFIALHIAYWDSWSEVPSFIDTTGISNGQRAGQPGLRGGLEGNSGNPGYSSKVKAIINICGALGDTAWIKKDAPPVLSFHGTNDKTVPYGKDTIRLALLGNKPIFIANGSSIIAEKANKIGLNNCMITWNGAGHVPEVGATPSQLAYYDSMLTTSRNFLMQFVCDAPPVCGYTYHSASIAQVIDESAVMVYPNPANNVLNIKLPEQASNPVKFKLFDIIGKEVPVIIAGQGAATQLHRGNLPEGVYLLQINSEQFQTSRLVVFRN